MAEWSLWYILSIFLTTSSLSSFFSLNPCFAASLLSMNTPVVPLFKSALTMTPSYVLIFFTPIFNHTSLSILKVLLTSLWLPPSFAVLFKSPAHVPPYCTFPSKRCAIFLSTVFGHPHHFCLFEITPCPLFSSIWHPFCPHLSHSTYDTITSAVYHSSSSRHASLGIPFP